MLRRALDDSGMTQAELADATGLQRSTISRIMSGRRLPSAATLIAIASFLDIRIEDLPYRPGR